MAKQRLEVTLTTDSSGDVTGYTDVVWGNVSAIRYVKADYANGVDVVFTGDITGQAIHTWTDVNASATVAPRQPTHDLAGAASLYAAAGEGVESHITIANERIKIVVAQGGDTKVGTFHIMLD